MSERGEKATECWGRGKCQQRWRWKRVKCMVMHSSWFRSKKNTHTSDSRRHLDSRRWKPLNCAACNHPPAGTLHASTGSAPGPPQPTTTASPTSWATPSVVISPSASQQHQATQWRQAIVYVLDQSFFRDVFYLCQCLELLVQHANEQ